MPSSADRLTAFVDHLCDDRRGAVLAGESTARFRGRVLMERAAWLVRETDRTLLEIALDSGFGGRASFATAFRREFGVLPSQWRAEPTSYVIDSPGDVHFHPPDGLRLPARQRADPGDLVVSMAEHHLRLVGELVDRADGTDGTADGAGAAREVLGLIVDRMASFVALATDAPPAAGGTLRSRYDDVRASYVDAVALVTATGRLDETYVDAFSLDSPGPTPSSLGSMVARAVMDTDGLRATARSLLRDPWPARDIPLHTEGWSPLERSEPVV